MKREDCRIVTAMLITAMVLLPVVPCGAAWQYLGSYVPNNPTYDSDGDGSTYYWEYSFSENTSADSGGVSASGTCNARTWANVYASESGPTDMSRSPYASCSTSGESYYYDDNPPNLLCVDWSVSGSGNVYCSGAVNDDYCTGSTDAGSSAASGTDADDGYGYGGAGGSAWTRDEPGSADVSWGGDAEEGSWSVYEPNGGYEASLSFSVEGSGYWEADYPDHLTQFTASASVYAVSSSSASASVSQGVAYASSRSDGHCSGSSSVSVSY